MWGSGSQTQVLILAQEAPYPLSHTVIIKLQGLFFPSSNALWIHPCVIPESLLTAYPCPSAETVFTLLFMVLEKYLFPKVYGYKQHSNKHPCSSRSECHWALLWKNSARLYMESVQREHDGPRMMKTAKMENKNNRTCFILFLRQN